MGSERDDGEFHGSVWTVVITTVIVLLAFGTTVALVGSEFSTDDPSEDALESIDETGDGQGIDVGNETTDEPGGIDDESDDDEADDDGSGDDESDDDESDDDESDDDESDDDEADDDEADDDEADDDESDDDEADDDEADDDDAEDDETDGETDADGTDDEAGIESDDDSGTDDPALEAEDESGIDDDELPDDLDDTDDVGLLDRFNSLVERILSLGDDGT